MVMSYHSLQHIFNNGNGVPTRSQSKWPLKLRNSEMTENSKKMLFVEQTSRLNSMARERCRKYCIHVCQDFSLEDEWTTTGYWWFSFYSFPGLWQNYGCKMTCVIVFATETTSRKLTSSDCWLMDANFEMKYAVYFIMCIFNSRLAEAQVDIVWSVVWWMPDESYQRMSAAGDETRRPDNGCSLIELLLFIILVFG